MANTSKLSRSSSSRRRAIAKKNQGDESAYQSFALRVVAALVLVFLVTLGVIVTNLGSGSAAADAAYTTR